MVDGRFIVLAGEEKIKRLGGRADLSCTEPAMEGMKAFLVGEGKGTGRKGNNHNQRRHYIQQERERKFTDRGE